MNDVFSLSKQNFKLGLPLLGVLAFVGVVLFSPATASAAIGDLHLPADKAVITAVPKEKNDFAVGLSWDGGDETSANGFKVIISSADRNSKVSFEGGRQAFTTFDDKISRWVNADSLLSLLTGLNEPSDLDNKTFYWKVEVYDNFDPETGKVTGTKTSSSEERSFSFNTSEAVRVEDLHYESEDGKLKISFKLNSNDHETYSVARPYIDVLIPQLNSEDVGLFGQAQKRSDATYDGTTEYTIYFHPYAVDADGTDWLYTDDKNLTWKDSRIDFQANFQIKIRPAFDGNGILLEDGFRRWADDLAKEIVADGPITNYIDLPIPTLETPADTATLESLKLPEFSWEDVGRSEDGYSAGHYQLQIHEVGNPANSTTFDRLEGDSFVPNHSGDLVLKAEKTYEWKVRHSPNAADKEEGRAWSEWSDSRTFTTSASSSGSGGRGGSSSRSGGWAPGYGPTEEDTDAISTPAGDLEASQELLNELRAQLLELLQKLVALLMQQAEEAEA